MRLQARRNTMTLKIVYYGPGMGGKTTNLKFLHGALPEASRGNLIQLDTENERTLFFDYFPVQLGRLGGYQLRVHFFSVPGQSFYRQTRAAVLQGADAVVFVADSNPKREQANLLSLQDMHSQLETLGQTEIPIVFQWNKQDLPNAMSTQLMSRMLNPEGRPESEAIAILGEGVQFTQASAVREAIQHLRRTMAMSG
ncbi:MAG: GTPase domain-containing protein [Alphaproteobacteria bacterium]|nr:GTPase domain-containing protein [Alphaproteobacteria bacterium]